MSDLNERFQMANRMQIEWSCGAVWPTSWTYIMTAQWGENTYGWIFHCNMNLELILNNSGNNVVKPLSERHLHSVRKQLIG